MEMLGTMLAKAMLAGPIGSFVRTTTERITAMRNCPGRQLTLPRLLGDGRRAGGHPGAWSSLFGLFGRASSRLLGDDVQSLVLGGATAFLLLNGFDSVHFFGSPTLFLYNRKGIIS